MRGLAVTPAVSHAVSIDMILKPSRKTFLKRFLFWSACYVLALPVCMLIAGLFAPSPAFFFLETIFQRYFSRVD